MRIPGSEHTWLKICIFLLIIFLGLMVKTFATTVSFSIQTGGTYDNFTDLFNLKDTVITSPDTALVTIYIAGKDSSGLTPNDTWGLRGTGTVIYTVVDSCRHNGVFDTTKYTFDARNYAFRIYSTGKRVFDGFQFFTGSSAFFDDRADNNVVLSNCIAYGGSQEFFGLNQAGGSDWYIYNSLFYDITDPIVQASDTGNNVYFYNCTFDNVERGMYMLNGDAYLKNCVFSNITTASVAVITGTITADTCVSTDAYIDDFSGAGNLASATVVYQDSAYDTLWLDPTSDGYQEGVDLSSDPILPFSTDITGYTRATPWTMGIKEDESAVTAYPFRRRRLQR